MYCLKKVLTALYFVMALVFVMWQEYHVFGSTRAGENPEEGKEENTEKVRQYISVEYMENFEVR